MSRNGAIRLMSSAAAKSRLERINGLQREGSRVVDEHIGRATECIGYRNDGGGDGRAVREVAADWQGARPKRLGLGLKCRLRARDHGDVCAGAAIGERSPGQCPAMHR